MKKPVSGIDLIHKVINNQITEEKYFENRSDSQGRLILDLPEIQQLKKTPHLLAKFLESLSVEGRFKVLFTKEMLGMPQKNFISKYGIPSDTISVLKGQKKTNKKSPPAEIRRVFSVGQPNVRILSLIAVFTRLPLSWLQERTPSKKWTVHHFHLLPDVHLSVERFTHYLQTMEQKALSTRVSHTRPNFSYIYDVRPIILHKSRKIYLRASILEKGGFIIELFGERNQLNDFIIVKEILDPFGSIEVGYCETVIEGHNNMMILVKSRAERIFQPVEFISFS